MLKIKVLYVLAVLLLLIKNQGFTQTKPVNDTCYGQGALVVNDSLPCCKGLDRVTEVETNKKYCDKQVSDGSRTLIWILVSIFPAFLLLFLIFGIRNKLTQKRQKRIQEKS